MGGLGIFLAFQGVDRFDYRRENGSNINVFEVRTHHVYEMFAMTELRVFTINDVTPGPAFSQLRNADRSRPSFCSHCSCCRCCR